VNSTEDQATRAILADLQAEIRRHRSTLGDASQAETDLLAEVRSHQIVNSHLPIGWPVMPQGLMPKITAYAQKIVRRLLRWYINPVVEQQNAFNRAAADLMAALKADSEGHSNALASVLGDIRQQLDAARSDRASQESTTELRLQRLEGRQGAQQATSAAALSLGSASVAGGGAVDYFLLGALYRNEEQTKRWLDDYRDIFVALAQDRQKGHAADGPVLDIGCGRGQLVAHLGELGLPAYGIDLDADAVRIGQSLGRNVHLAEAVAHLAGLDNSSLAAVVMIQVVEHIEINSLLQLLMLIRQKLASGGFVLAETLNPACVYALTNWYLMDPSHRTPLHPQTAEFLLSQAGFHPIQTRLLHPVPESDRLQGLPTERPEPGLTATMGIMERNIGQLNNILYGPQDYAVIGYKPAV
jgi:2-polyprenyl-3-methyl-5-hydroxy-6-metoxy-1,4-benzoquinol methylase